MSKTKKILVRDVMLDLSDVPVVPKNMLLKETLELMGKHGLGIACVIDDSGKLLGVLTDGDIRRKLLKIQKPFSALFVDDALDYAVKNPVVIKPDESLSYALGKMEEKGIWDLPVVGVDNTLIGLLHLHRAVKLLLDKSGY